MDVRPLHLHRPHLAPRGRRPHRARRYAAIAALCLVALALAACGGEDGGAGTARSARDLLPHLEDIGFTLVQEAPNLTLTERMESHRALYSSSDGRSSALLFVFLADDESLAAQQFTALRTALKNPPPDALGGPATMVDAEPVEIGEDRHAYVTEEPDSHGNLVWTDVVREGRTVAVLQLLAPGDGDHRELRASILGRVLAAGP